ncbi:hypothetical protein CMUS01_12131 [Colletotrichum musicola]|uniref:Uncharacterized protein n=1 Tax=Colletotrichum musicola TaxID=2175873 RepID=A0A8H6JR97_9PEZI|nr:hypothetical protein CMUS01_12131 [Colletotrichum musicola]
MSTAATAASASHANAYEAIESSFLRRSYREGVAEGALAGFEIMASSSSKLLRAAPARPFGAVDDATRRGLLVCLALPPPPFLKSTYFECYALQAGLDVETSP